MPVDKRQFPVLPDDPNDEENLRKLKKLGSDFIHGLNPFRTTVNSEGQSNVETSTKVNSTESTPTKNYNQSGNLSYDQTIDEPKIQSDFNSSGIDQRLLSQIGSTSSNYPKPGSTLLNAGDPNNPRAVPVNTRQLAAAGNQRGITRGNGFEFEGTAADAAKFFGPMKTTSQTGVGQPISNVQQPREKTPLEISMENSDRMKNSTDAQSGMPRYLSRAEGSALGLGWKGRLGKYKEDVDLYNRATGNQTLYDIEQMREGGANSRELVKAMFENDKINIDRAKLDLLENQATSAQQGQELDNQIKQTEFDSKVEKNKLRKYLSTLTPGSQEYNNVERRLAIASEKFGEQKQPNIQMIEDLRDPNDPTSGNVKRPIKINEDGTYTKLPESKSITAESIIQRDPQHSEAYKNASPEEKARMLNQINAQLAKMAGK